MKNATNTPDRRLRIATILFALAAPLLAASTFAYAPDTVIAIRFIRWFSMPVTAMEWIIIGMAMTGGVSVLAVAQQMPRVLQLALVILILIAGGTAATATADPISAIVRTAAWGAHLLFGFTLYGLIAQSSDRGPAVWVWPVIVTGLLLFAVGLVVFVAFIPDPLSFQWIEFYYGVLNVRQLGFYSGSGFAIAIGVAVTSTDSSKRLIFAAAAALLIAISFWSGTRSSLLAIVCGLGFTALMIRSVRTAANGALVAAALGAGVALAFLHVPPHEELGVWRLFQDSQTLNFNAASGGRLTMWFDALEVAKERPWFGFGESQYRLMVPGAQANFNHPHNGIVQIIFQWGGIGALCFFSLFGWAWWRVIGVAQRKPDLGVPALLTISTLFAIAMIEGSLYHTWPVAMMTFACATALGGDQRALISPARGT